MIESDEAYFRHIGDENRVLPERPLRVIHVILRLTLAGMEYGVIKLVNRLDRRRFRPYIVSIHPADDPARKMLKDDVELIELGDRAYDSDFGLAFRLFSVFRKYRVDVVHSHNWPTFLHTCLSGRMAGVPVVVHGEHGRDTDTPDMGWKRRLVWRVLRKQVDQFMTVSENIREELVGTRRVPYWKVEFVPNGVDVNSYGRMSGRDNTRLELGIPAEAKVLGTVGWLREVKDHENLLRSFQEIEKIFPGSRLVVVGQSPSPGRLRMLTDLRDSLCLREKAIFLGGRTDIPDLLAAFDVYVNNSIYEGMSNTILEAMAAGLPVVATKVGGTPAILEDGGTGILIPPRDPQALAGAVQILFEQASKREEYGRRGREFVLRKHSMARMVERNETCYLDAYCHWRCRSSPLVSSQRFRIAVGRLLDRTGFCRILEWAHSGSVTILTYHRVLPASVKAVTTGQAMIMEERIYKQQIQFLAEKCHPVTMEEALRGLRGECRLPERAVTVTFDDGYRDNYEYAFPTLRHFGVPATIFLSTGVIDEGKSFWWDRFSRMTLSIIERMGKEPLAQLLSKWPACFRKHLDQIGNDATSRLLGVDKMAHDMCHLGERFRRKILDEIEIIAERAGSEKVRGDTRIVLDWNEIREMSNSGIEFGAHTVTHAYLDEISDEQVLSEVRESGEQILKHTGKRPRVFSYPGGRLSEMAEAAVQSMGFEAAMTTQLGRNVPGCNLFRLRRLDGGYMNVNGRFSRSLMRFEVTSNYRTYITKPREGLLACAESPGY